MINQADLLLSIAFWILVGATVIQLFYYFYYYLAVTQPGKIQENTNTEPISVIICARDEAENLSRFLPAVLKQDYPDYEVIVVNDCSEDDSYIVLGEFLKQYSRLKVSTLIDTKFNHSKKFAQFIGIKASKNEILVFTDADCQPESDKWLSMMSSHFDAKTNFVLGYGGYLKGKGLLNKYIRYDTMTIAMQYIGMARRGSPYMGVGRNLAYRRSVFFNNRGFGAHSNLASGDDDLFVNTNATGKNTIAECRKEAHTRSVPARGLSQWARQKKRHMTTAPYYKMSDKILLLPEPASRVLFYSSFILLILNPLMWQFALAIFGVRFITMIVTLSLIQKKLNEGGILPYSLIFDIFSPLINGVVYLGNLRSKPGNIGWK